MAKNRQPATRLTDKKGKQYSADELFGMYSNFTAVLKCFEEQVAADFDTKLIELQQEETLDLTSANIGKVKQQLAEEIL